MPVHLKGRVKRKTDEGELLSPWSTPPITLVVGLDQGTKHLDMEAGS